MDIDLGKIFYDMLAFDPDKHRTNHLLKVDSYAEMIGLAENMESEDLFWLRVVALMHDIGIKSSLEKYNSAAGPHQQVEGPPIAKEMLSKYTIPPQRIHRVCWLIAHHHEYSHIEGLDYQILIEADFLVNCDEGNMEKREIISVRDKIFKTTSGIRMLDSIFQLI